MIVYQRNTVLFLCVFVCLVSSACGQNSDTGDVREDLIQLADVTSVDAPDINKADIRFDAVAGEVGVGDVAEVEDQGYKDAEVTDDVAVDILIIRGTVSERGTLSGVVTDGSSSLPMPGVSVVAEDMDGFAYPALLTDANGHWLLDLPSGRYTLIFSVDGYLQKKVDTGVGSEAFLVDEVLAPLANKVTIGPEGYALLSGSAILNFPSGAFESDTEVSATWLEGPSVAAAPGNWLFLEDGMNARIITGVLHVETPQEPGQAVEVNLPLPEGGTMENLGLYELDADGNWSSPVAPDRIEGDSVIYMVEHFSDKAQAVKMPSAGGWVITSVSGTVTANGKAAKVGDVLGEGATVKTRTGSSVKLQDPTGTVTTLQSGMEVSLTYEGEQSTGDYIMSVINGVYGDLRAAVRKYDKVGHSYKCPNMIVGVRGTVPGLSSGEDNCPEVEGQEGGKSCKAEVLEGSVDLTKPDGGSEILNAGDSFTSCGGGGVSIVPGTDVIGDSGGDVVDGGPCDDGNRCTVDDSLKNGVCTGRPKDCDDANSETKDTCNPSTGSCEYSLL